MSLALYSYYRSSCSYRVRIGLYFKNLDFEYRAVNLIKEGGEQFEVSFTKINPLSQVPCLKDGNKVLSQSLPILLYLEELQAEPPLLPQTTFEKAQILSFCEMINSGIQPLQNLSVLNYLESYLKNHRGDTQGHGDQQEQSRTQKQGDKRSQGGKKKWSQYWIKKGLQACERFLQNRAGSFCFGDQITLADLFLIPQIYNARRFGLDRAEFPLLEKINQNCLKEPCFQKAVPENQPDHPELP